MYTISKEPNTSLWGCITGKSKWSDFLKPQTNNEKLYKLDLNVQSVSKDKKTHKVKNKKSRTKQKLEKKEKEILLKRFVNESGKPAVKSNSVKNVKSIKTFDTKIPHLPKPSSKKDFNKGSLPVYKLKRPKSEGHNTQMQLKVKDNILHLYNIKGMKHKKVILQGLPVSNIFPKLVKHKKNVGFRPVYPVKVNPIKITKSKSLIYNDSRSFLPQKCKQEPSPKLKSYAKEQLVIPRLLNKIKSMEQQIQSLENTTKKIDEKVSTARNLQNEQNIVQPIKEKRKSIVTISYKRSNFSPIKKNSLLFRKKLRQNKLKRGSSKTVPKFKNKEKYGSKLKTKIVREDFGLNFFNERECFDILAENLRLFFKSKLKEKVINSHILKLTQINSSCNHLSKNINYPELLQIGLSSEKIEINSTSQQNNINNTREVLESENVKINNEDSLKIDKILYSTDDYNQHSPKKSCINILSSKSTYSTEVRNFGNKAQKQSEKNDIDELFLDGETELNYSNQLKQVESCLDSHQITNEEQISPHSSPSDWEVEFPNKKCEKNSISLLNKTMHDVASKKDDCNDQYYIQAKEINQSGTKFNITIFINEENRSCKKTNVFNEQENISFVKSHLCDTTVSTNTATELPQDQKVTVDLEATDCDRLYKYTPMEDTISEKNYQPVSCSGELDKLKFKHEKDKTYGINNDKFQDNSNDFLQCIAEKSESQVKDLVSKPYLSKKQRKDIQEQNEMNQQTRFKFNDSSNQSYNLINFNRENDKGDANFGLNMFHTNIRNNFYNITDKDYRFGDTERTTIGHVSLTNCFQTSLDKTVNKPFCSIDDMHLKNFTHRQSDKKSFYCHEMYSNITPLRRPENNLTVKSGLKYLQDNKNSERFRILSENINTECDTEIDNFKINDSFDNMNNEVVYEQFVKHAGQKLNKSIENNWEVNRKCNLNMFSSMVSGHERVKGNLESNRIFDNSKTVCDYTMSRKDSFERKGESGVLVNNKNKQTIKIKFSTFVDARTGTKRKNNFKESNEYFDNCSEYENSREICLPMKKCEGQLRINNSLEETNELKQYSIGSNGIDNNMGNVSLKNKKEEMIAEIITCIKEMTVNQVIDQNLNKGLIANTNCEQNVSRKEFNLTQNGLTVKNQTILEKQFKLTNCPSNVDLEIPKIAQDSSKCEHCVKCQEKITDKCTTNSNSEFCVAETLKIESPILTTHFADCDTVDCEVSNDKNTNDNLNLINPILISPSQIDFKLKKTSSVASILNTDFENIGNNLPTSREAVFQPLVVSYSGLFFNKNKNKTLLDNPLPVFCSQPVTNNTNDSIDSLYNVSKKESISCNSVINKVNCSNIFKSLVNNSNNEKDQSTVNQKLNDYFVQNKVLNSSFEKVKLLEENNKDQAYRRSSSLSVLKLNGKNKNAVRPCYSDSNFCFPSLSTCSSSNTTLSSSEPVIDTTMFAVTARTKHFLADLKEKIIETMKVSSEQCIGQCKMMMDLYDNACEFQKISSDWVKHINQVKTVSETEVQSEVKIKK